jgi:ABC-type nitrate/sulfonate/bicarbonate transport system ATPase subunit
MGNKKNNPMGNINATITTDNSTLFHVDNLTRVFGRETSQTVALSEINLSIYRNEFACILGESGCGKSTLLHIMAGLDTGAKGKVRFRGEIVERPHWNRGVVFQQPSLLPWLTVRENMELGLTIRGKLNGTRTQIDHLLKIMDLQEFANHLPKQLSGGMAQRASIARSLANKPEALLLDEPFGALDAFTRIRLQEELVRIWTQERFTAVFVTHDIEEAVFLGTRVIVLSPRPGKVARIFNVGLRRPRNRDSIEFIRLRMMIAKEFQSLVESSQ